MTNMISWHLQFFPPFSNRKYSNVSPEQKIYDDGDVSTILKSKHFQPRFLSADEERQGYAREEMRLKNISRLVMLLSILSFIFLIFSSCLEITVGTRGIWAGVIGSLFCLFWPCLTFSAVRERQSYLLYIFSFCNGILFLFTLVAWVYFTFFTIHVQEGAAFPPGYLSKDDLVRILVVCLVVLAFAQLTFLLNAFLVWMLAQRVREFLALSVPPPNSPSMRSDVAILPSDNEGGDVISEGHLVNRHRHWDLEVEKELEDERRGRIQSREFDVSVVRRESNLDVVSRGDVNQSVKSNGREGETCISKQIPVCLVNEAEEKFYVFNELNSSIPISPPYLDEEEEEAKRARLSWGGDNAEEDGRMGRRKEEEENI